MKTLFSIYLLCIASIAMGSTKTENRISAKSATTIRLIPQMSIFSPAEFTVKTPNGSVPYSENFAGLFFFNMGVGTPVFSNSYVELVALGSLGYTHKEGRMGYVASGQRDSGEMVLNWFMAGGGIQANFFVPDIEFFTPTLFVGSGVHLFSQDGPVAEVRGFQVAPYYCIAPGIVLLDGTRNPTAWFGGFHFSTSYWNTIATEQRVSGLSINMSLLINL